MNILFIEDDVMSIEPLVDHLRIRGHSIDIVDDVGDAQDRYSSQNYDIVFLDVMLPPGEYYTMQETADGRYTGLKLLESLRHIDSALGRNVRIFVLTNWRDEPQIDAACRSFRAEIIRKPMSIKMMDDLCNRVKSIS